MNLPVISRREFLQASGALIVGIGVPGAITSALSQSASGGAGKPPLTPDQLDSWIAVLPDGSVTAFYGKTDMGQGIDVAIGQIVAEELDVAFEKVTVVLGDTAAHLQSGRRVRQHRHPVWRCRTAQCGGRSAPHCWSSAPPSGSRCRRSRWWSTTVSSMCPATRCSA